MPQLVLESVAKIRWWETGGLNIVTVVEKKQAPEIRAEALDFLWPPLYMCACYTIDNNMSIRETRDFAFYFHPIMMAL